MCPIMIEGRHYAYSDHLLEMVTTTVGFKEPNEVHSHHIYKDLAVTQLGGILLGSHEGGRNVHDQRTVDLFKLGCLFYARPWVIVLTEQKSIALMH